MSHIPCSVTWLLKEWLYRDASWETPCTLGSAIFLFVGMGLAFWGNIVLLTTGGGRYDPGPVQLCCIVTMFTLGIWLHHTADTQKYFVLRAKRGLITDGLFSRCRNPNYLGEMMIYAAFAGKYIHPIIIYFIHYSISAFGLNHPLWWWSWANLIQVWVGLFYPSWLAKDRSMSRYPQWSQYISHTGTMLGISRILSFLNISFSGLFLPWPFGSNEIVSAQQKEN